MWVGEFSFTVSFPTSWGTWYMTTYIHILGNNNVTLMKWLRLTGSSHMILVRHKSHLLHPNRAVITQAVNCRNNHPSSSERNNPELFPSCTATPSVFSTCIAPEPLRLSLTEASVDPYVFQKGDFLFSVITRPKRLVYFSAVFHTKQFYLFLERSGEQ